MSWDAGRAEIDRLIEAGELQHVAADQAAAGRLLADAHRHIESADAIAKNDLNGAFAMAYDAIRKACSALLETQGLRATSRGGHIAIRDAVLAQFADRLIEHLPVF